MSNSNGCVGIMAAIITAAASLAVSFISLYSSCSTDSTNVQIAAQADANKKQLANQAKKHETMLADSEAKLRKELQQANAKLQKELEVAKRRAEVRQKQLFEKTQPYCEKLLGAVAAVQAEFDQLIQFSNSKPVGPESKEHPLYLAFARLQKVREEPLAVQVAKSVEDSVDAYQKYTLRAVLDLSEDVTEGQRTAIITQSKILQEEVKTSITDFLSQLEEGVADPQSVNGN